MSITEHWYSYSCWIRATDENKTHMRLRYVSDATNGRRHDSVSMQTLRHMGTCSLTFGLTILLRSVVLQRIPSGLPTLGLFSTEVVFLHFSYKKTSHTSAACVKNISNDAVSKSR